MLSEGLLLSVGLSLGLWVSLSICTHVFSLTVDIKRGYVGMCNGRSAQQESGSGVVQEQHVYGGGLTLYTAIILGVH